MLNIKINNKIVNVLEGTTLHDLSKLEGIPAYCAKVNNRLRELQYVLNNDATVEFLDLSSSDTMYIYNASIRYLVTMAVENIYPHAHVVFKNSVSRTVFCEIRNIGVMNSSIINAIDAEMRRLVSLDLPFVRYKMTKEEAHEFYMKKNAMDKVAILKYRPSREVHFYQCGDFLNYMYSYMVFSTGYLSKFKLKQYAPGFVIQLPRAELNGEIPEFEDAPTFALALREANNWGKICKGTYVYQLNEIIENEKELEFINLCETKHNDMLADLGLKIKNDINNIRLIAVAGPSSSGKTTFTNRLRIELMSRGISPIMISIDNYYLSKDKAPKDENGEPDLEHINALDIELFNQQMFDLINGQEVTLPVYDFELGKRVPGETVKAAPNQPILIEGIHALNDDLTPSIPLHQKFKIYISPQAQMSLDDHNPISLTELRLLRRIVRDYKFRNSSAEETLAMWPSVRRGEFRWIYKNQEGVNYVFNSELTYEICVLKKYALPLLEKIPNESQYYIQASRLTKFLKYFKDIPDDWIPCNSILREFIGGSSFYRK